MKNKNQETDGYGRDKRRKTEKLKRKEITTTENQKNTETEKKPVKQSGYPWNQSEVYARLNWQFSPGFCTVKVRINQSVNQSFIWSRR